MTPISPVLAPEFAAAERVYAADQPEYSPLPVIRNSAGVVLSRWKLTDEERKAVVEGAETAGHLFITTMESGLLKTLVSLAL